MIPAVITSVPSTLARSGSMALARRYHELLTVYAVLAYYTGYSMYLGARGVDRPSLWLIVLAALTAPLMMRAESWRALTRSPVVAWTILFVAINVASLAWSSQSSAAMEVFRSMFYDAGTIVLLVVVFSTPRAVRLGRIAVGFCVALALLMNMYELLNPGAFSVVFGRAAGLYGNPNTTGAAIVLGVILSIDLIPIRWRGIFTVLTGTGVLMTMSRGGILGFAFVLVGLVVTGRVGMRSIVINFGALIAIMAVVTFTTERGRRLQELTVVAAQYGLLDRLANPAMAAEGGDQSTTIRIEVLKLGWQTFERHPWRGAGIGATFEWGFKQSTHNIYVRHLAEFGAVGFVLFPLLLLAATHGARGSTRSIAVLFAGYLLMNGLITHNILEERIFLVAYVLMGAMSWESTRAEMLRRRELARDAHETPDVHRAPA